MAYTIIVKNSGEDNLRTFETDQFDEALKYMESGLAAVSTYRIQIIPKGPKK
jgi:hypothetical protein